MVYGFRPAQMKRHFVNGLAVFSVALVCNWQGFAMDGEDDEESSTSPNARFVFRPLQEKEQDASSDQDGATRAVFDTKTRKPLLFDTRFTTFPESIRVVWSKDSKRVAFNYRAGGRYYTTSLFEWDGKKFLEIPSPEEELAPVLAEEKVKMLKAMGLPEDTSQRRISDTVSTNRWVDGNTVVVDARSVSSVLIKGADGEDIEDVRADFRFTEKFDFKTRKWKTLKAEKLAPE